MISRQRKLPRLRGNAVFSKFLSAANGVQILQRFRIVHLLRMRLLRKVYNCTVDLGVVSDMQLSRFTGYAINLVAALVLGKLYSNLTL